MKRIAAVLLAAGALLGLSACGDEPPKSDQANSSSSWSGSDFKETLVKLKDGRSVLCIVSYREPSCDWLTAQKR